MRPPDRDTRELQKFFEEKKAEGLKLIIVVVPDRLGSVYGKKSDHVVLNLPC